MEHERLLGQVLVCRPVVSVKLYSGLCGCRKSIFRCPMKRISSGPDIDLDVRQVLVTNLGNISFPLYEKSWPFLQ